MIIIIGSKGFIGSHLLKYFNKKNIEVIGVDIVADYETKNYVKITNPIVDFRALFKAYPEAETCINASGAASVPKSIENPHEDFLLNTLNVHHLLEGIRLFSPHCKFINLSSAAVYGNPIKLPVEEHQSLNPISPYGYHKMMAETLCEEYASQFNLQTCSARIFSAYGEGLTKQLFWDLYKKTIESLDIQLFGNGEESRDFIYINDLCVALEILLEKATMSGEAYNIASGIESKISEVVKLYFQTLNWDGKFTFSNAGRKGDPSNWKACTKKIEALGFNPKFGLKQGLENYVKWLKEKK